MMITSSVYAQKNNKYGVESVSDKSIYFEQLQNDSTQHLVDLTKNPGLFLIFDMLRKNNFTGSVVHPQIGGICKSWKCF